MTILAYSETETFYWYKRIEEFLILGDNNKIKFCKDNHLDAKKFSNLYYRIHHPLTHEESFYNKMTAYAQEWVDSGMSQNEFSKKNGISYSKLAQYTAHIRCWKIIEKLKKQENPQVQQDDNESMNFIKIPITAMKREEPMIPEEPEVFEKQNDIEIIISKGVKVSIAPNIDSMKIIKIIELLKDL